MGMQSVTTVVEGWTVALLTSPEPEIYRPRGKSPRYGCVHENARHVCPFWAWCHLEREIGEAVACEQPVDQPREVYLEV